MSGCFRIRRAGRPNTAGTYYMHATGTYDMPATGTYVMSRGCQTLRMAVPPAYKLMVQSGKHMEAHLGVAWWCWWWC